MKTKKWKIKLEFEWDAWDIWTKEEVRSKAKDLIPYFCKNAKVKVEFIDGD